MEQLTFKELNIEEKPLKVCAFTGHREMPLEDVKDLKKLIVFLIEQGVDKFLCGMAIGFDLYAANCVLQLKKRYPHIKITACAPYYGQEKNFPEKDKILYARTLKKCDEIIYVSEQYTKGCMHKRNQFMADNADCLIAYIRKDTGGTAYTVKYFSKKNKPIFKV